MVRTRWWDTDRVAIALLGATLLVVVVLLAQAVATLRSHDRMVEATLEDFATFASQNLAAELNATFSSIFLDEIVRSRAAHYAWVSGEEAGVPPGRWSVPDGAIPVHFSIDEDRVVAHDGPLDPETAAWILAEVVHHAEEVYPDPAPYALLRSSGPRGERSLAYRKETGYDRVSLYGFLIDFVPFEPVYARVLESTPTLPARLAVEVEPEEVIGVELFFPQNGQILLSRRLIGRRPVVDATSVAAKAGRIAVRVELDAERGRLLTAGASTRAGVRFFVGLTVLTLGLLAMAVGLMRRAVRLNQMRERFVANVSHDLRTPLAQIRMFSETLLLGRLSHPEERKRSLEIIGQQATHLSNLVDNVLHASGRAGVPLQPIPTDLEQLLRDATDALAATACAGSARISWSVVGPVVAEIDPTALRRILVNLVDNALKYGPAGQTVTVTVDNEGESLVLFVDDEGPGVPPRDRLRVWERFLRLDHDARATTGTGIGLSVVRDLAQRHGGHVRLEESPAGGSRLVVRLATAGLRPESRPSDLPTSPGPLTAAEPAAPVR